MDKIKSPLNYSGNKYRMLEELLDIFPNNISMLYDVFGGGGTVSINTGAEYVYYNDIIHHIPNMYNEIKLIGSDKAYELVDSIVSEYQLSKTNEDGFLKLREDYNNGLDEWYHLYALITNSFNYQLRFNNSGEYNSSFGRNRSYFNPTLRNRFKKFADRICELDIVFSSCDFRDVDFSDADSNDLIYLDPPYNIGNAVYHDGKRGFKGWNKQDDLDLFEICDKLDNLGVKFVMSNAFRLKGKENKELIEWAEKYKISYPNIQYQNCSYKKIDKKTKDVEVIIYNY